MYDFIPTPAVVVELGSAEDNIRQMVESNWTYGIKVRPHIKAHKSVYLAKLQLELGCVGITCAKLGEAEVMADAGISDILLAFPLIGIDKMERLTALLEKADVKTIINSYDGAKQLSDTGSAINKQIPVLVDVDGGINRGGVNPGTAARDFSLEINNLPGIKIVGLIYYSSLIYNETSKVGFNKMTIKERDDIVNSAVQMKQAGLSTEILSGGSSFTSKLPGLLNGLTEVRPGNFIFNDCNQLITGFATKEQCSLRIVATVVALVDENRAIIDAGSKTLTTDLCVHRPGYGFCIDNPDIYIDKLNEEHGFISSTKPLGLKIGDKLAIIPNHACVIPNLADEMYGIREGKIERMIKVDARGKNR